MTFEQWWNSYQSGEIHKDDAELMDLIKTMAGHSWEAAQPQWQPPETAPKDGTTFLADIGLPWPVVCAWNGSAGGWAWAEHQIDIYKGQWNEVYFQTEWETEDELKAWMPLPELPKE